MQEERHSLAAWIFHGKKGEIYQRYHAGMEDQLGALGLVLNCVALWNTVYMNAALDVLRARGHPAPDEDVARLSRSCAGTWASTAPARSFYPSAEMAETSDPKHRHAVAPRTPLISDLTQPQLDLLGQHDPLPVARGFGLGRRLDQM